MIKLTLRLLILVACFAVACGPRPEAEEGVALGNGNISSITTSIFFRPEAEEGVVLGNPCEEPGLYKTLLEKLVEPNGEPLYRNWKLFPGTSPLERLGLPVHGRWTMVYVDTVHAFPFLQNALKHPPKQPLELPPGSIIVKENYRSSFKSTTPFDSLNAELGVLTVMYKPTESDEVPEGSLYPFPCATDYLKPYNGDPETGCLGGRWFFAFYKVSANGTSVQCQSDSLGQWLNTNVNKNVGSFCVHCHAPAYRTDYLRILDDDLNPRTVAPTGLGPVRPLTTKPCEVTLQPHPPSDVPVNPLQVWASNPESANAMLDCFSWQTFVALSWPADSTHPGQPDTTKSIKDIGSGPTVWETYTPVFNLFQAGDTTWTPPPFGSRPKIDSPGCENTGGHMILTLSSKARDIVNETGQAFAGTFGNLIDRNGNKVWYEVLTNEIEYDYIVNNGLASTKQLTPSGPANFKVNFPYNKETKKNSIEVKSAWKQLCTDPGCKPVDDTTKYYTRDVLIYNEKTKSCSGPVQVGLIGLHLSIKTFWAPQWVWATFSHNSNVPVAGTNQVKADSFSFFDPSLKPPPAAPPCDVEPFLVSAAGCPNVVINRFRNRPSSGLPPWFPSVDHPNQITRLVPLPPEVTALNNQFQAALEGTPFKNYILVNTQWPLNGQVGTPNNPVPNMKACEGNVLGGNCFQIVPFRLRNPVIESYMTTYVQDNDKGRQISNRGCLNCHMSGANGSYLWLDAVGVRVPVSQ